MGPIETKVKASTAASIVAGFILWVLATYVFKGVVPEPVALLVFLAISGGGTFLAGYLARHTARPDQPIAPAHRAAPPV